MVFASTRLHPNKALTSLIIFALADASNDSNFAVRIAFSAAAGGASSAGSAAWPAGSAVSAAPTGVAATGNAISAIFSFASLSVIVFQTGQVPLVEILSRQFRVVTIGRCLLQSDLLVLFLIVQASQPSIVVFFAVDIVVFHIR